MADFRSGAGNVHSLGCFRCYKTKNYSKTGGVIKKTWVRLEGDPNTLNLGQIERLNIVGNGSYHIKIKILNNSDNQKNK